MNIDFGVTLDDVGVRQFDKAYITYVHIFFHSPSTDISRSSWLLAGAGWLGLVWLSGLIGGADICTFRFVDFSFCRPPFYFFFFGDPGRRTNELPTPL